MLRIIHKKHKDRYRIQFCNENFYSEHLHLFKMWKTRFQNLSDVEKLQAWVLALSCLRRPQDWFGGKRSTPLRTDLQFKNSLNMRQLFKDTPVLASKKVNPELDLYAFINEYKVKALPEACFRSLCFMIDNTYPLKLVHSEISPLELLQKQIKGERVVALNEDIELWPHTLYSQRDFLGFTLHDLIHADHFFCDPQHRQGQIGFYKFIESFINDAQLQELFSHQDFKTGFEYIVSDMNSHPVHLFQTLHSLLFKTLKNDHQAQLIWQNWIHKNTFFCTQTEALNKINTQDFSYDTALKIEYLCKQLGTNPVN